MDRQHRLTDNRQFQSVRKTGKSWAHPLVILGAATNGLAITRYGVTTSKQINGAVARNRARRLLRECVRSLHPGVQTGWDVVLVARGAAAASNYRAVRAAVERLLRQARLIPPASIASIPSVSRVSGADGTVAAPTVPGSEPVAPVPGRNQP
jgi:ribonuclease P protein component